MVFFRIENVWAIAKAHPIVFLLMVYVSVILCIITLRKTPKGTFNVPGICFFIGFLLPAWWGITAGWDIGDSEMTRKVSGSERWSRAEFYYSGLQLVPIAIMLLTRLVINSEKIQAALAKKDETKMEMSWRDAMEWKESSGAEPTELERFRINCAIYCALALFFIIVGLNKP